MPVSGIARSLGADILRGLSDDEARKRLASFGPNRLRVHRRKRWQDILGHQFRSMLVWLLAGAAGFSFMLGDLVEGGAILAVLAINAAIGFGTELRAVRSMESLRRIAQVRTLVRRDGRNRKVDAGKVVPGDLVILEAGDIVTADLRLVRASNLESNESVLTGEPVPVAKATDPVAADAPVCDRVGMVFKGTAITKGTGEGLVTATGMATEIGRISALTEAAGEAESLLERRLDLLAHRLVWLMLALAVAMVAGGVAHGHPVTDMIKTGVALAVAAVPEGLPVVATLCLARGMWRMAARNAVIRNLASVETLGATTVILTDKTGTLTENEMTVVRLLLPESGVSVIPGRAPEEVPELAFRLGALCTTAEPGDGRSGGQSGDPMELALLDAARQVGIDRSALADRYPEVREHAFDPVQKMMATVHRDGDGYLYAVKGAPEHVLAAADCEWDGRATRPLDKARRSDWARRQTEAAAGGLRLIGLAMKRAAMATEPPYTGLTFVGIACLRDPLRADVPGAIRASQRAGVRVVMLTGDHADTAAAIARDAGIGGDEPRVVEGHALGALDAGTAEEPALRRIADADIFARVAPETKLSLVKLFQDAGHVVAMTGDGVNDAPALRKAHIGIAMGRRGTDVAREAADMILKDDAFATIIVAMHQGRVIFDNIRRFVIYLMSCNVSEILVVGIAVGAGLPPPLLPLQILFLNLVTDVFPAFALGLGRGDAGVMERPPRDPAEPVVGRPEWVRIALLGIIITAATLGAFWLALGRLALPGDQAITVAFLTLALAQLWNVFNVRTGRSGFLQSDVARNPFVWAAIALCTGLLAVALALPELALVLDLPHPGKAGLILAFGMSLVPLALGQGLVALGVYDRPGRASDRDHPGGRRRAA
jgi:Ca2+-transporting ATPase